MRIVLCISLIIVSLQGNAQVDKQFWFSVPEVTDQHGDEPMVFRFTSFDKPANVTISFPANKSLSPLKLSLGANSSGSIDVTSIKGQLENVIPDQVLNRGVLIESTSLLTAYYEVNASNNPDIFALKGNNALGTEFYTPFQNTLNSQAGIEAYSSFDLVATEDSTFVTILPSKNIVGHTQGVEYTILLNKGQTYSARSLNELSNSRPSGSLIKSNKPIAVTIKDDSVLDGVGVAQFPAWDLIGDQLVPTNIIGDIYGLTFGRGYILATKDNTIIKVKSDSVIATLNAGETYLYNASEPVLIEGNENFYLLQVGGIGFEIGGAILPPLKCTGSKKIAVTQSEREALIFMVLVQEGGESSFVINQNSTAIKASSFTSIGGGWMAAELNFSEKFNYDISIEIENKTHFFHLGMRNGTQSGARFGYFSDFGFLDLGVDVSSCQGDSTTLNAGPNHTSYLWSTGDVKDEITVGESGIYWVEVYRGNECPIIRDSVYVNVSPEIVVKEFVGENQICNGDSIILLPGGGYDRYEWDNGSIDTLLIVKESGVYGVTVYDEFDCSARPEDFDLEVVSVPEIDLGNDTIICPDATLELVVEKLNNDITWSTGSKDSSITVQEAGFYKVVSTNKCGSDEASIIVDLWNVSIPNIITPNGDFKNDFFFIDGIDEGEWELIIQNRWGGIVYENENYQNSFTADKLNDGTYYYNLKQGDTCNTFKGWLYVIRNN